MTEPPSFDPFSVLVHFIEVLTGRSSLLVWTVVIANGIVGWFVVAAKAAQAATSVADRFAKEWRHIPGYFAMATIQAVFFVTGTMVALQWGEIQILDLNLGMQLSFLGGDFAISRQSLIFWILIAFNLVFLALAWTDVLELKIVPLVFIAVGVGVVLLVNHTPSSIAVHAIYSATAIGSLALSQWLFGDW